MIKIKLIKRVNHIEKDKPAKWYGVSNTGKAENTYVITRNASENTSTAPTEMDSSIELFFREAIKELLNGNSVRAGRYGNFRIAFRSEGVEDINEFNANSMIKDARIVFQPSKLFRSEVINNLQFTVNCVTEDEVKYASLSDYRRAKGISGGGSGSDKPSGGDSGGGLDENPLG